MGGQHNVYLDIPDCFIVFNDDDALPFDPVEAGDIYQIGDGPATLRSMAWSADVRWFFVIADDGIALFGTDGGGWFCRKRSAEFIRMYVERHSLQRRPLAAPTPTPDED